MPDKSRRRSGKYASQRKKRSSRSSHPSTLTQSSAVTQVGEAVASPGQSLPEAAMPTPQAEATTVSYLYIAKELRTIGILAGIMLIALVVLAWALA